MTVFDFTFSSLLSCVPGEAWNVFIFNFHVISQGTFLYDFAFLWPSIIWQLQSYPDTLSVLIVMLCRTHLYQCIKLVSSIAIAEKCLLSLLICSFLEMFFFCIYWIYFCFLFQDAVKRAKDHSVKLKTIDFGKNGYITDVVIRMLVLDLGKVGKFLEIFLLIFIIW